MVAIGRGQVDYEIKLSDRLSLRNKTYYRSLDWDTAGTLLLGVGFGVVAGGAAACS